MKRLFSLSLAAVALPVLAYSQDQQGMQSAQYNNSPVSDFNLSRYLGRWYEIARFDHSFERGMDNVMAEYVLREDGRIDVINSGWKKGEYKVTEGKAKQPDPLRDPAHLEVSFFLFFNHEFNLQTSPCPCRVALLLVIRRHIPNRCKGIVRSPR